MKLLLLVFVLLIPMAVPLAAQVARDSSNQDRADFLYFVSLQRRDIVEAAIAMPADKYQFTPSQGAFADVRSFGHQLKHLAATNYILASAALGMDPPADAGDEMGPDSVVTKQQIVAYLKGSFDLLERAVHAIGDPRIPVRSSDISPFQGQTPTRIALVTESMIHAFDHYGQIVVYLRMNGVIPPASRR